MLTAGAPPQASASSLLRHAVDLGWANVLIAIGLVLIILQIISAALRSRLTARHGRREGEELCEVLLRDVVALLAAQRPWVTYRSLVTIVDESRTKRYTVCGAFIRTDPELTLEVPIDFGIAGRAVTTKAMSAGDLDDATRTRGPDGAEIAGIWPSVASVLAFPLCSENGEAFGTVNFDTDHKLAESGLGDRKVQDILGSVAEMVGYFMRGHSSDGIARLPR
ncbi:hypothetical protein [Actinomadura rugatobispora]|uniref:GAF domain-containing protein n=1 Tax=Actinomadura rugatobispora TaxID=1994 RepID=A0ABW0ZXV8_9ACTN|nr:hypothetical protein GCM10010200_017170 [Actinomadura rugatobispora]